MPNNCPGCLQSGECTWLPGRGFCPVYMRAAYGNEFETLLTKEQIAQLEKDREWLHAYAKEPR